MTAGSPARLILLFALPLIAGNIFQQLYGFVDTLLVGRLLGVEALAAVGSTGGLMFLSVGFVMGFSAGLSICTGQRFGAKDEAGVRRSAAACFFLSFAAGIVLLAVSLLLLDTFLTVLNTPADIYDDARAFIQVIFAGIPILMVFTMTQNLIRALGDSKHPTIILSTGLVVNIIVEMIFLLVFGWGVVGAAAAILVAQFAAILHGQYYIYRHFPMLRVRLSDFRLDRRIIMEHLKIGLPMGFQSTLIAIGALFMQWALNGLGPVAVASYAASMKVDAIAMMPMMSFGMAMATYTAQNYGAQRFDRIVSGVRQCICISVGFAVVTGLLNALFGKDLIAVFVAGDAHALEVIDYGQTYLVIQGSCYWVLALLFIYRYTLQGLGYTFAPTFAGVMELVMRGVAAFFLVQAFQFVGASWASPLAWIGSCVPLLIAYYRVERLLLKRAEREERLARRRSDAGAE